MPPTRTASLADERFVSFTTFRRDGTPVATPVWVGAESVTHGAADDLVAITPTETGKVKRLRRDARVELRACDRRGRVEDGTPVHTGRAELLAQDSDVDRIRATMRDKYGWEYRIFMAIEAVVRRQRHTPRVGVRISLDGPQAA